tara:strand:- start:173 stop:838 length:666 start_codon:yes stop_codon:yes gene_type:complete
MESLERSKAAIEIGKRIVEGLRLGEDVTAQWMAHLLAEKISAAEASEADNDSAISECVDLVLKLWTHRYTLPPYMRPMRELAPLLQTLNSLGVNEASRPRYFSRPPSSKELEGTTEEEKELLEVAVNIDQTARELIRYFLSAAAERSHHTVSPWLEEAKLGGLEAPVESLISRFVAEGFLESQAAENRESMIEKADRLENFARMALCIATDMREIAQRDEK